MINYIWSHTNGQEIFKNGKNRDNIAAIVPHQLQTLR